MSIAAEELRQSVRVRLRGNHRLVLLAAVQLEGDVAEHQRRTKVREKSAKWRRDHLDQSKAHGRDWRAKNPARKKFHDATWRARNPEMYASMRRKANRRYYLKRKARLAKGRSTHKN